MPGSVDKYGDLNSIDPGNMLLCQKVCDNCSYLTVINRKLHYIQRYSPTLGSLIHFIFNCIKIIYIFRESVEMSTELIKRGKVPFKYGCRFD